MMRVLPARSPQRRGVCAKRTGLAARTGFGVALLFGLSLSSAASAELPPPSIGACLQPAQEIGTVVKALKAEGWAEVAKRPLDEALVEALIWPLAMNRLLGDSIADVLELERAYLRRVLRAGDTAYRKRRILKRQADGQLEAVLIMWVGPRTEGRGNITIKCNFAWSGATIPAGNGAAFVRQPLVRQSDGLECLFVTPKIGCMDASYFTIVLNPAALARDGNDPGDISATTTTDLVVTIER